MVRKGAMEQHGRGERLVPGLAMRAGQTVAGKYCVEELVRTGAGGAILLSAHTLHAREDVTLEILASYTDEEDERLQHRLEKARRAARLHSKHITRIVDIGVTEDGMPFIATERPAGSTLEVELAERGRLDVEEATRWIMQACEGLAEAHAMGLVHGALKPHSVFLAEPKKLKRGRHEPRLPIDDEQDLRVDARVLQVRELDASCPLDALGDQHASRAYFGSPAYLAPEQIQDATAVDARTDIWALGVLLYEMIAGSLPFEADTVSGVLVAVVYDAPALLTDAPYALTRIVHRCLEKDPADRPQDVRELAEALAPFAGEGAARQSGRVAAMLEAPPTSEPTPLADASASGSMPPVSVTLDASDAIDANDANDANDAHPLDAEPAGPSVPADVPTHPSLHVLARRRRSRARTISATLGAGAALAFVAFVGPHVITLPTYLSSALTRAGGRGAETVLQAPDPAETVAVPAFVPAVVTTSPEDVIPTPIADVPQPGVAPPMLLAPAPIPEAKPVARPLLRLPPGLPTTRDGLAPATPPSRFTSPAPSNTSLPSSRNTNDQSLRTPFPDHR